MNRSGKEAIEMSPMVGATHNKVDSNGGDHHLRDPTHQTIEAAPPASSKSRVDSTRRARNNYLAMIGLAYVLTILSPGTVLWSHSSSLSCIDPHPISNASTALLAPVAISHSSVGGVFANGNATASDQNAKQGNECDRPSISISILAKLTLAMMVMIALFFNLQGSDPGLLTGEVTRRLDESENSNAATTISNGDESSKLHDEEAAADATDERKSFMEPSPSKHPRLYPHTRRKYCHKCKIHPPLRSHHCKINDRCIATFDHHCRFLDTCIGERNHFRFWMFVSVNVVCLKFALGIVGTGRVDGIWEESPSSLPLQIGQAVLVLSKVYMRAVYVVGCLLWTVHTALALGNITTFEMGTGPERVDYLRGTAAMDLPFGKGPRRNLRLFVVQDDAFRWTETCFGESIGWRLPRGRCSNHGSCCKASRPVTTTLDDASTVDSWMPTLWKMPEFIERESEDWWNHPWQNKYWSCC